METQLVQSVVNKLTNTQEPLEFRMKKYQRVFFVSLLNIQDKEMKEISMLLVYKTV